MKAVILAGGKGTRISEETAYKPKPMITIGGKPILWHILKIYSSHGINDFVICCGYKGYLIKEYFANYFLHMSDVTFDMQSNTMDVHENKSEPWKVTLVDTGEETMTGGRLLKVMKYLGDEDFCFTYGDGVGDVDITSLIEFHKSQQTLATLTSTYPPGRFGAFQITQEKKVSSFKEKPKGDGNMVNGGFFVLSPKVAEYIKGDDTVWENEPLSGLANDGELSAYEHHGFWQPMDTLRDKNLLEEMWDSGEAPWKMWK
ncbi:MAG: glucose-1-phosphate cytidylyltransferase [Gammaproteobacteria bacterium]|nr:MAG: glucose-1-phosphate cytidylyltransferase [Gammaproteobacteria bacterium]